MALSAACSHILGHTQVISASVRLAELVAATEQAVNIENPDPSANVMNGDYVPRNHEKIKTISGCTCKQFSEVFVVTAGQRTAGGVSHKGCGTGAYEDISPAKGQPWCDTIEGWCNGGDGWDFCNPKQRTSGSRPSAPSRPSTPSTTSLTSQKENIYLSGRLDSSPASGMDSSVTQIILIGPDGNEMVVEAGPDFDINTLHQSMQGSLDVDRLKSDIKNLNGAFDSGYKPNSNRNSFGQDSYNNFFFGSNSNFYTNGPGGSAYQNTAQGQSPFMQNYYSKNSNSANAGVYDASSYPESSTSYQYPPHPSNNQYPTAYPGAQYNPDQLQRPGGSPTSYFQNMPASNPAYPSGFPQDQPYRLLSLPLRS